MSTATATSSPSPWTKTGIGATSGFVFVGGQYVALSPEAEFGYGADHWNSLILSHAYYLAVEGGTHRTSGVTVEGIGGANREEMERIFFRAMRDLMPAAASLPIAAEVLRQAAADLAPGSDAERAIDQRCALSVWRRTGRDSSSSSAPEGRAKPPVSGNMSVPTDFQRVVCGRGRNTTLRASSP